MFKKIAIPSMLVLCLLTGFAIDWKNTKDNYNAVEIETIVTSNNIVNINYDVFGLKVVNNHLFLSCDNSLGTSYKIFSFPVLLDSSSYTLSFYNMVAQNGDVGFAYNTREASNFIHIGHFYSNGIDFISKSFVNSVSRIHFIVSPGHSILNFECDIMINKGTFIYPYDKYRTVEIKHFKNEYNVDLGNFIIGKTVGGFTEFKRVFLDKVIKVTNVFRGILGG